MNKYSGNISGRATQATQYPAEACLKPLSCMNVINKINKKRNIVYNKSSLIYNTAIVNSSMEQEQASEMPRAAGAGGREKVKVPKVSSAKYRAFVDRITERLS